MDKILDKFYNGSITNNQFPTSFHGLKSNKFSSPNLLGNSKYNINTQFPKISNNNSRYIPPMPRTNFSNGLQAPIVSELPTMYKSTTIPFSPAPPAYSAIKKNYEPNEIKIHLLESRIKEVENQNKEDQKKIAKIIENSFYKNNNQNNKINNLNYETVSLEEALNRLRNPDNVLEEIRQKQNTRRAQIKYELDQARKKMKDEENLNILKNYMENLYLLNLNNNLNNNINNINENSNRNNNSEKSSSTSRSNSYSNSDSYSTHSEKNYHIYNKYNNNRNKNSNISAVQIDNAINNNLNNIFAKEQINQLKNENLKMQKKLMPKIETEDFINSIPKHVALQLQNDNFKIRENIATIKEGFRDIKNQLETKLDELQMKQKLNFETIRYIIEQGGTKKLNAGYKKYIDGEDINLNDVQEDVPEYIKNLPKLIEDKLKSQEEEKNILKNLKPFDDSIRVLDKKRPLRIVRDAYNSYQYIAAHPKNSLEINDNKKIVNNNLNNNENKKHIFGVGDQNMDSYIPIKMNGCFDDWYKDKNKKNENNNINQECEFQIDESVDNTNNQLVGINAIKQRVNGENSDNSKKSKKNSEKEKEKNKKSSEKNSKKEDNKKDKKEKDKEEKGKKEKDKKKKSKNDKKSEESKNNDEENEENNEENEENDENNSNEDNEENNSNENNSDENNSNEDNDENNSNEENNDENNSDENNSNEDNDENNSNEDNDENNSNENNSDENNSNEDNDENNSDENNSNESGSDSGNNKKKKKKK